MSDDENTEEEAPAPPPAATPKFIREILSGKHGYPKTREEAVARYLILVGKPGTSNPILARWCGVSLGTIKRWKKEGPEDRRPSSYHRPKKPLRGPRLTDPAQKAQAKTTANYQRRMLGDITAKIEAGDADLADIFAGTGIPADYDALRILKKITLSNATTRAQKISALRIVAAHENQRGRIPWESLKVEMIPTEIQHRLAGMLLHLVAWDELPEEVRLASPVRRQVYRLVGLLPGSDAIAEQVLARWGQARAELRAVVAPQAAPLTRAPLAISIAVEAGERKPG